MLKIATKVEKSDSKTTKPLHQIVNINFDSSFPTKNIKPYNIQAKNHIGQYSKNIIILFLGIHIIHF